LSCSRVSRNVARGLTRTGQEQGSLEPVVKFQL
jgi:hypothetical protein